jgi:AraC-like DNA-binding protein
MTNVVLFHLLLDVYDQRDYSGFGFSSPLPDLSNFLAHLIAVQVLLFAPLMAEYTKLLTGGSLRMGRRLVVEAIPALLFFSIAIKDLVFGSRVMNDQDTQFMIAYFATAISMIFYLIISFRRLSLFSESVKSRYSSLDRMNYTWLKIFLSSVTFVTLVAFFMEQLVQDAKVELWCAFAGIITFATAIYGFLTPNYFSGTIEEERMPDNATGSLSSVGKYAKSALAPDKAMELEKKIIDEMVSDKLYLNPELSLYDLAERVGSSSHAISQVLNDRMKMTFYEFVNLHRIEEAKRIIRDPKTAGDKIVSIAMDSGFNSLSTFNAVFRKFTDMTPSQYRRNASNPIG